MPHSTQPISARFSQAARQYDQHAPLQKQVAYDLFHWANRQLSAGYRPKSCLDIGSGTGFLTTHLLNHYPDTPTHAIDQAPGMLAELVRKHPTPRLTTQCLDGETLTPEQLNLPKPTLLMSSMCAQWFNTLEHALRNWLNLADTLAFSILLNNSFEAWHTAHTQSKQPCGLHPLPSHTHIEGILQQFTQQGLVAHCNSHTHTYQEQHPNGLSFARSLRAIGADTPQPNHRPANLRPVLSRLKTGCTMNYHIGFYYVERP